MEIKFSGRYDKNLFFRSVHLANQPARRKPWVLPMITTIVLVIFIVLFFRLMSTQDILGNASYIVIVMIAGSFVARSYLIPYFVARKLWGNPAIHEEHTGSVSQTGIVYYLKIGKNEISWERFNRVRRAFGITVLVTRDGLMVTFTKSFFRSEPDWQKFNQLVDSKIIMIK
jgi:hypothetical protein